MAISSEVLKKLSGKDIPSAEWHLMRMASGPYCYDEGTPSPIDKTNDGNKT